MLMIMNLKSYESSVKYEFSGTKFAWYDLQILRLSVSQKVNKFESYKKKRKEDLFIIDKWFDQIAPNIPPCTPNFLAASINFISKKMKY
jgi:hypothetical protein